MPTNVYFSQKVSSEQDLYEDIVIESIKMYGQDIYYIPRNMTTRDNLLGEDVESSFDDAYLVEMYIENTEGFEGEGNLLSKFGLEIRDEATFIVARRSWQKFVAHWNNSFEEETRPMEGDLLYIPMTKSFFEISFVEHEQPFYQLSNLPTYKLQARLFEYNDEDFDTGIAEIDSLEKQAFTQVVTLQSGGFDFNQGEQVYQTFTDFTLHAEVASIQEKGDGTFRMELVDLHSDDGLYHDFVVGTIESDEAYAEIISVDTMDVDELSQNNEFENVANNIIDFSESNPFGEPNL